MHITGPKIFNKHQENDILYVVFVTHPKRSKEGYISIHFQRNQQDPSSDPYDRSNELFPLTISDLGLLLIRDLNKSVLIRFMRALRAFDDNEPSSDR